MDRGFRYPGQVVSVRRDEELPTGANECGGSSVNSPGSSGRDDVPIRHRETVGPTNAFKRYRFCVRAENDDGASGWQIIGTDDVQTLPGKPGNPSYDSVVSDIRTHDSRSHIVQKLVWSVKITETTPAPQRFTEYDGSIILRSKKSSATADAVCVSDRDADYEAITPGSTEGDTLGGIQIILTAAASGDSAPDLLDGVSDLDTYYFYACVKANPSTDRTEAGGSSVTDEGPWVIGRSVGFKRTLGTPSLSASNSATDLNSGQILVTVGSVTGATAYELEQRITDTADGLSGNQPGAWGSSESVADGTATVSAGVRLDFRARATTTVRGDTVNGEWSRLRSTTPKP